jgi:hypothetical protein
MGAVFERCDSAKTVGQEEPLPLSRVVSNMKTKAHIDNRDY